MLADRWLEQGDQKLRSRLILTILASFGGKLFGFLKLQQIAVTLGISQSADILIVVQQLLWFVEIVFVSGAVLPILVAQIYRVDADSQGQMAPVFFVHAVIVCTAVSLGFTALLVFFPNLFLAFVANGTDDRGIELFRTLLLWGAGIPVLLTVSHFLAMTNRLSGNGVWYSTPQIVINGAAIVALLIGARLGGAELAAKFMVLGISIGAIIVMCVQSYVAPKALMSGVSQAVSQRFSEAVGYPGARYFWPGVGSLLIATVVNEIYIYVDFYFAAQLEPGSVSAIGYASRLATLTNMLFVTTAFVILEPRWARAVTEDDAPWEKYIAPDILTVLSLIAAPLAALYWFAPGVTDLIYRSSSFEQQAQDLVNSLTQVFGLGTFALALSYVTTRAVIAAGHQRWIFIISLIVLPLKILLSILLVPVYDTMGLAVATVISFMALALGNLIVLTHAGHAQTVGVSGLLRLGLCFVTVFAMAGAAQLWIPAGILGFICAAVGLSFLNIIIGVICRFGYAEMFRAKVKKS